MTLPPRRRLAIEASPEHNCITNRLWRPANVGGSLTRSADTHFFICNITLGKIGAVTHTLHRSN